jgi:hypothetical protein
VRAQGNIIFPVYRTDIQQGKPTMSNYSVLDLKRSSNNDSGDNERPSATRVATSGDAAQDAPLRSHQQHFARKKTKGAQAFAARSSALAFTALAAFLVTLSGAHALAIDVQTFDHPLGVNGTIAHGLDGNRIVGSYTVGTVSHGFLYDGSSFETLDYPSAHSTYALAISGVNIVGVFGYSQGSQDHSFLYDGSTYTELTYPSASSTLATGISGSSIVGSYTDATGQHGFLYNGSSYMAIPDHPLTTSWTIPRGIDGSVIVGQYRNATGSHGFLYDGSSYSTLDHPLVADNTAFGTIPRSVSGSNVVGSYLDAFGTVHGFLNDGSSWTTIDGPSGTTGTEVFGVSGNVIVGKYQEASGFQHGFIAVIPEPSSLVLAAFGLLLFAACHVVRSTLRKRQT